MILSYVMRIVSLSLLIGMTSPSICLGAEIECKLTELSDFDDSGISIQPFFREPKEKLILQEITLGEKWFMQMGATRPIVDGDRLASVMIVIQDKGDLIYVDRNNDEDLTNDGEPIFFPLNENDLWIFKRVKMGSDYQLGMLYQREPKSIPGRSDLRSKLYPNFVDSLGHVRRNHVNVWGRNYTDFEGKPHRDMTWPQVAFTEEVADLFSISSYPTNILILPDGKTYREQ